MVNSRKHTLEKTLMQFTSQPLSAIAAAPFRGSIAPYLEACLAFVQGRGGQEGRRPAMRLQAPQWSSDQSTDPALTDIEPGVLLRPASVPGWQFETLCNFASDNGPLRLPGDNAALAR